MHRQCKLVFQDEMIQSSDTVLCHEWIISWLRTQII